jgi:hypothetical protein
VRAVVAELKIKGAGINKGKLGGHDLKITGRRLGSDLNRHDQDEKQLKDPCQLCTEGDRHVVPFWLLGCVKQDTNDVCSYIAENNNYFPSGLVVCSI